MPDGASNARKASVITEMETEMVSTLGTHDLKMCGIGILTIC